MCTFAGKGIACQNAFGTWLQGYQMWCRKADPQPPKTDPIWRGHEDEEGAVYSCARPEGGMVPDSGMTFLTWLPAGADRPAPDPEAMAWQIMASINLQPIDRVTIPKPLEVDPDALGIVGMPLWMWPAKESPNTTGPISARATDRGYTVSLTARLHSIQWDLGDGSKPVVCKRWTKFNPRTMDRLTPVVCGSQLGFERESEYTSTFTSRWIVDWQGVGASGSCEFPRVTTRTLRIGEVQVLATNTKNR